MNSSFIHTLRKELDNDIVVASDFAFDNYSTAIRSQIALKIFRRIATTYRSVLFRTDKSSLPSYLLRFNGVVPALFLCPFAIVVLFIQKA